MKQRLSVMQKLLATVPYLLINIRVILSTTGSIVHMSPAEWTLWTALSSLAVLIFVGLATLIEPAFWTRLLRPMENGIAYWLFVDGIACTLLAFIFASRRRSSMAEN